MKLKDLNPHPQNPRKISDPKLKMLKKSLDEFGDLSGIIFNKRTQRLVGGHQRLKVLPPDAQIVMDTETHGHITINGERYSYREVEWDEIKEKAANIAANKHGGEWDYPILTDWILELDQQNYDLDFIGFEKEDIEKLLTDKANDIINEANINEQSQFIVAIMCKSEFEMQDLFNEFQGRGLECKLIT